MEKLNYFQGRVVLRPLRWGVRKSKFSNKVFGNENKVSQIMQILIKRALKMYKTIET